MKENSFTLKKDKKKIPHTNYYVADYTDDIALLANTPTQAESLLHSLEQAAGVTDIHVKADKTEYMCFSQEGDISILNCGSLKLVDNFMQFNSSFSSTENDINMGLAKAWTPIDK